MHKKLLAFNRAVLSHVQELDSIAADTLRAEGSIRGWWDNIHYWHTQGWSVDKTAEHIVTLNREENLHVNPDDPRY